MKIEVEAKVRVTDHDAVTRRLVELKAEPVASMMESNIFVDSTEKRLHTADRGLRVRRIVSQNGQGEAEQVTVTFKGPRQPGKLKSRREVEFDVSDEQAAMDLFAELGMHEVIRFEKRRERYRLDDCTIELDEMPYLGCFAEIEGPNDKVVLAVREKIGLGDLPLIKSSYVAMLTTYLEDHDISSRDVTFESARKPRASAST